VYLLPITGVDLVLGAAWLATIGPHLSDYSSLTLKFYLDNQFITLHGQNQFLPKLAQFNHMRMQHTHAIAEIFTLQFFHVGDPRDHFLELHHIQSLIEANYFKIKRNRSIDPIFQHRSK